MDRRPDDLLPLLDACALVGRSLSTLRAWIRAGELTAHRETPAANARVLVSRAELLSLATVGAISAAPGRRPPPPPSPSAPPPSERLLEELLLAHRATVATLTDRCADLRTEADTWRGRAEAAEAEAAALREILRTEAGRPLWSRLLGLSSRRSSLPGE